MSDSLRPKKSDVVPHKSTISDSSDDDSSASTCSYEDSDSDCGSKNKRQKLSNTSVDVSYLAIIANNDYDDEENEYELQRQKNMNDRLKVLKSMDFDEEKNMLGRVVSPTKAPVISQKPARRLQKPQVTISTADVPQRKSNRIMRRNALQASIYAKKAYDDFLANRESLRRSNRMMLRSYVQASLDAENYSFLINGAKGAGKTIPLEDYDEDENSER